MIIPPRQRQTITLAPDESVELAPGAELVGVRVVQHAEATVPAIVAGDGASGSHHIRIRDVEITGGRPDVWAVHLRNPYEFVLDGVFVRTQGNGLLLEATNDHPYNPGDGEVRSLHIRLLAPGATGVRIAGQQPQQGGHYGGPNRYPANVLWSHLYVTAGDRPTWASEGHVGVEIVNAPKHTFVSVNLEELATCMRLAGQVGGGAWTTTISLLGGWLAGPMEVNAGVSDVVLAGTRLDAAVVGAGRNRVALLGTDMSTGTAEPFLRVPRLVSDARLR